jgi:hypothetical protein
MGRAEARPSEWRMPVSVLSNPTKKSHSGKVSVTTKEFSEIFPGATFVMAEPKKEAVRSALPQRPELMSGLQRDVASHDIAQIPLPPRSAAIPPRRSSPTITLPSLDAAQPSPVTVAHPATVLATSKAPEPFDSTPRWFCWGLLGISALIFLIQIWNYALS